MAELPPIRTLKLLPQPLDSVSGSESSEVPIKVPANSRAEKLRTGGLRLVHSASVAPSAEKTDPSSNITSLNEYKANKAQGGMQGNVTTEDLSPVGSEGSLEQVENRVKQLTSTNFADDLINRFKQFFQSRFNEAPQKKSDS